MLGGRFFSVLCRWACVILAVFVAPTVAHAQNGIIDALNLAPFVPLVLDAFMMVATGGYEFFVGNGDGIVYILIWGFLVMSLSLYAIKLFLPKNWISFLGFTGGGQVFDGSADGMSIGVAALKPVLRAIIAAVILLQIKPVYITEWLVNPFLKFGAIYTDSILETINVGIENAPKIECPPDILEKAWISEDSCAFLVQPVSSLSYANNRIIKRGFEFITNGLGGMRTLITRGNPVMSLITGILLVFTFVSCNMFMALLIIQGIFNFGMALILYPFQVLTWVAKPKNPDKWFDIWPAFSGIVNALQQLIVTMIACAFILCVNVAVIRALFQPNGSVFVGAAGGSAGSNISGVGTSIGAGGHSMLWLSSILTFYLMFRIFDMTRQRLNQYAPGADALYNKVKGDTRIAYNKAQGFRDKIKQWRELRKLAKGK